MTRGWGAVVGVVGVVLGASAAPASAFDLRVVDVEVTQAVQTETNSIPLVANRSTAVRATVSAAGRNGSTAGAGPVNGRLHVFQNGTEITPPAGVPAINQPFTPPAAPNRANEAHTLNFELPAPTGIGSSGDVDFRVDVEPQANEEDQTNNSGSANDLLSQTREYPRVYYVRVNYAGGGLPDVPFVRPGTGDAFICGILPVDDSQPDFYSKAPLPSINFNEDANGNQYLDNATEGEHLLDEIAAQRQLLVDDGLGANDLTHLYGWLKGPVDGNGLGELPGHSAFGNTDPVRGQRTFAHELTHNFGLDHIDRDLDPLVGWDVGAGLDQNPVANNTTGRVKPQSRWDVQVAGQLTNTAWVDEQNYRYFLDHESFGVDNRLLDRLKEIAREKMLVVRGRVDPTGMRLRELEPAFRYPWKSQYTPPPIDLATLDVVVTNTKGERYEVVASATVGDDAESGRHTRQGFFEAMVPVKGTVASVRVRSRGKMTARGLRKAQLRTIGVRRRSIRAPSLSGLRAIGGKTLSGKETIDWSAFDRDTKGSRLRHQAAYSPDGGKSFVPIDADIKGSKVSFNSAELPPSKGTNGLIRIFVSDGINSTYRDLRGISVKSVLTPAPTACQDP